MIVLVARRGKVEGSGQFSMLLDAKVVAGGVLDAGLLAAMNAIRSGVCVRTGAKRGAATKVSGSEADAAAGVGAGSKRGEEAGVDEVANSSTDASGALGVVTGTGLGAAPSEVVAVWLGVEGCECSKIPRQASRIRADWNQAGRPISEVNSGVMNDAMTASHMAWRVAGRHPGQREAMQTRSASGAAVSAPIQSSCEE